MADDGVRNGLGGVGGQGGNGAARLRAPGSESNCPGDAPTGVIAELREAGVQSWVFNLGQGDLTELVPPESEVRVADGAALGAELRRILGLIREEAGSFAAAAVPLTQANAADKIYLTQFTPVDGAALWPGRIDAFLRPLPMDYGADPPRPRFDHAHHLWEAGAVLTGQAPPADEVPIPVTREALRIGPGPDQRRILYPMRATGDAVPRTRQLLGPPADGDLNAIRVDLWQGLGIVGSDFTLTNVPDDVGDLFARHPAEAQRAHRVLRATYVHKTERVGADDELVTYVLGDVFHSTPLIVGPPSNTRYLANEGRFPGYGDFHRRQARPIFFPPAVIFSSRLGRYALAFGTGNRDDLWAAAPLGGNRFYLFVDDSDVLPPSALPLTEAAFEELTGEVSLPGSDYLQHPSDGHRGWFLRLGQSGSGDAGVDPGNEKVITAATAISGITTFVTFLPQLREGDDGSGRECAHRGSSRSYVVLTSNGDAILDDGSGQKQRFRTVAAMLSEPFVEQDQSDVPGEPGDPDPCAGTEEVAEILKREIFPPHCRYGNYRFNVRAVRSDTGVECLAQVPICVIEKNWKEF